MKTIKDSDFYYNLNLIIDWLKNNNIALMETDTVLGLFSKNEEDLYLLKNRPKEKKIVLLIKNIQQIPGDISDEFIKLANKFWPGKLTIIYHKIAYRIPNHPQILKILDELNSIYCTSANISGHDTIRTSDEAFNIFENNLISNKLLVVKGKSYSAKPSTIYNLDEHKIIREGEISLNEINEVLKEM